MLQVNHVTKKYGKLIANNDLSFEIGDGEIGILLGPNGAGKSTLIKAIAGLLRFTGEIYIGNELNKTIIAKRKIGYIPEIPCLYPLLTVWEHLEFMARAYKLNDWEEYAEYLLKRFEIMDKKDKLSTELSKGMQQKVSICCGLVHRPEVVIFDEPMVGLDPYAIKELKRLFLELKEDKRTILISTHMIESIEDHWDMAYIMKNGEFIAKRLKDELIGESLEESFFETTIKEE
ncbi:ABC transporter ATP-binding protein [Cellulosilyticum lentocellum]|uniref:ABC transporter related protein n=1 Tax=Cellulosilyticum lentocellum (strain ATCC 49066 / DSM 5427 / NCIMB 11756 / RHM5) TaxID=642492 RepID=F2JGC7_CELLD|nr:ABC transporter ATP-binding protein [Cellulosilyticum lentocellum]ADZ81822.1 ABC transporter related protein [Cellulosilyticum lentocellum DSM 5427]